MVQAQVRRHPHTLVAALAAAVLFVAGLVTFGFPGLAGASEATCTGSGSAAPRAPHIAGIVHAAGIPGSECALGRDPNSGGGTPPLLLHGGTMMATPPVGDGLVVTPIFWAPSGYAFDSGYQSLLTRYLGDAAHDSDLSTNVFSTLFEYAGSDGYFVNYRMSLANAIIDSTAFPAAGCVTAPGPIYADDSGYTTCLNDAQVTSEIDAQVSARHLPRDLGHMYVLFLPKHVESCFYSDPNPNQACTLNEAAATGGYCAYHGMTGNSTVYANMPFPIYSSVIPFTCGSEAAFPTNESPNGNTDADVEISPLSHEISEAMTDPDVSTGWYDSSGYENGDECAYEYGAALGAPGAYYNQVVNGHRYLTQEEFSNNDFNLGHGGCLQSYVPAAAPAVTSLSTHAGSKKGKTTVTITGTTMGGATAVYFGTTQATFVVVDPTHIRATAPAHARGTVDVTVQNSQGTSPTVAADRYTYS